jgi:ABC-type glucose/galactose transport system permease subunit
MPPVRITSVIPMANRPVIATCWVMIVILCVAVFGVLVGLVNGAVITRFGVAPFICTLGTDGQVNAAGEDHQRHTDGQQAGNRHVLGHDQQVRGFASRSSACWWGWLTAR